MNALTKQSIQRLCECLGAFRLRGPIRALMAEFRPGVSKEETSPLEGFADAACSVVLRWLRDGQQFVRSVWLAGECALVEEFRIFCEQAGRLFEPGATGGYWLPLPERPQPERTRIELASTEREQRKLETTWSPTGPAG